jgi:hypothetical protein
VLTLLSYGLFALLVYAIWRGPDARIYVEPSRASLAAWTLVCGAVCVALSIVSRGYP